MSKFLKLERSNAYQGLLVDLKACKDSIAGADAYSWEWYEAQAAIAASQTYAYFHIIGSGPGDSAQLRFYLLQNGLRCVKYGPNNLETCVFTFAAPQSCKIKITSSLSGNSIHINGVQVTPNYTVGSSSNVLSMPDEPGSVIFRETFCGYLSNIKFYESSDVLLSWPCDDSSGSVLREELLGLDGITYGEWVDNIYLSGKALLAPLGSISERIDKIANPPTNELMCAYKTIDTDEPIYSETGNWSAISKDNIKRNTDLWMPQRPLTCASVWSNSNSTYRWVATLISPRHAVLANHVGMASGTELLFVDEHGNRQETTLLDQTNVYSDLTIGILSDDITLDIEYAQIPSDEFIEANCNSGSEGIGLYACGLSREGWFDIMDVISEDAVGFYGDYKNQAWFDYNRLSIEETSRTGDSSRPSFIYNGSELVFLFSNHSLGLSGGRFFTGPSVGNYKDEVKLAMDSLDTTYERSPNYSLIIADI